MYVGLTIELTDFWSVFYGVLLTALVFVLRIPIVRYSVARDTPRSDASIMSAMVPKGFAAAVLASIPLQRGIEGGEFIQNVTYTVVLFSIVVTSVLIFLVEKTPFASVYHAFFSDFEEHPPADPSHTTEALKQSTSVEPPSKPPQ